MRVFHRIYAWIFGYFWIPCPKCGKMFGGHESKGSISQSGRPGRWVTCCVPEYPVIWTNNDIMEGYDDGR